MSGRKLLRLAILAAVFSGACLQTLAGDSRAPARVLVRAATAADRLAPRGCEDTSAWQAYDPLQRLPPSMHGHWFCIRTADTGHLLRPAIAFESLRGSLEVFVDGQRTLHRPAGALDGAGEQLFQIQNVVAPLPVGAGEAEIVARLGGGELRYAVSDIRVGEENVLVGRSFWMHADNVFAAGLAFLLAGFVLGFALIRPRRRSIFLTFAAFMSSVGMVSLAVAGVAGHDPEVREWIAGLAYAALLFAPAALCRFQALLGGETGPRFFWMLWRLHAVLAATAVAAMLFFGVHAQEFFTPAFFALFCVSIVGLVGYSVRDALDGRGGARFYAIALALFSLAAAYDALGGYMGLVPWRRYTFHFGVFALTLALGYMMERRMNLASDAMREYASGLEAANKDLAALNRAYSRFVPGEFLHFLKKTSIVDVRLGDNVELELTIMVTDIHSFTAISEKMSPEENFDFINSYFGKLAPVIRQNGGYIAKYTGDGLMALFPRSARDGVDAALAVQKHLVAYNEDRVRRGRTPIHTGIGVHTGVVRLGTVGDGERMQGDVMGDAANLAARIEGLTRIYGALIVMSEKVYRAIESLDSYDHRMLDIVRVKGKVEPIVAIELLSRDADASAAKKIATREQFREGLSLYMQRQFPAACDCFQRIIDQNDEDAAARIYYDRSLSFAMYGPPPDWEPVEALDQK